MLKKCDQPESPNDLIRGALKPCDDFAMSQDRERRGEFNKFDQPGSPNEGACL